MKHFMGFVSGLLFALGLGISGMTKPTKVLGFLDLSGSWDPSLMFVMVGGIAVYATLYAVVRRRPKPVFEDKFHVPPPRSIDRTLLLGAGLFGVGWGLGGYCPGPALTALAHGAPTTLAFVAAMVGGMFFFDWSGRKKANQ